MTDWTREDLTLANCADEPIHIPGSIQPHGILLAFDPALTLAAWSANCGALLGCVPALGMAAAALRLPDPALELLSDIQADLHGGAAMPMAVEVTIGGQEYDCIIHAHEGRIVAEFEHRVQASDVVASFALKAHSAIERLKRQQSVEALLNIAVTQVRSLTGFDRVMAYRFRHDDSGDVVAEARSEALEPFLGRRYPASDIPAQARRLYLINTLRLIADVGYTPVPVFGRESDAALDMSHAVLRSVSPIHIEYLHNTGVAASMSISIVCNGRLWGMLACHHMRPHQVPYSIRMAADVFAQVLASTVQTLESRAEAGAIERGAELGSQLLETLSQEDDLMRALEQHAPALAAVLEADALIMTQHGDLRCHGEVGSELASQIVASVPDHAQALSQRNCLDDWPPALRAQVGKCVGMLVLSFDPASRGMLLALRREQIEAVRWAGPPDKVVATGPNGPRLTPRGSFAEWRETVRGRAEPWDATALTIAGQLLSKVSRFLAARNAEIERARMELMAMLGHDLRDPLQAINMAGALLERGSQSELIGRRIQSSSNRMERLIGHVLDMSRINGGIGLGLERRPTALDQLVRELVEETAAAHPASMFRTDIAEPVMAVVDSDRLVQVLSNLLSNARQHGDPAAPITVGLARAGDDALLTVRNHGPAIAPALAARLFDPFKHTSLNKSKNRGGVGLGLYIAQQIVLGHQGSMTYHHAEPEVVFTVRLPCAPPAATA
ncbi:GAF domain-containing protein [Massilia sp. PAMC28688]|uniref:ATP-binding protein n=1 Tax=Massilia sp. PAMC28688 TaxID=2861283 RepID=UPI001C63020F|nr:ATP-binding protein [Massilia sp. PAMC28688]QYF95324.1 GAF domain-containing protein [Massilia sp. PAMC28688]